MINNIIFKPESKKIGTFHEKGPYGENSQRTRARNKMNTGGDNIHTQGHMPQHEINR